MRLALVISFIITITVGIFGGMVYTAFIPSPLQTNILLGALYAAVFVLIARNSLEDPGTGLIWGLGYALLLWLVGPAGLFALWGGMPHMGMLDTARAHFPEMVG